MRVFFKNSELAEPLVERKKEHIVAKTRGPIRHRQARFATGHQAAQADEDERAKHGKHCQTMQPRIVFFGSH